MRPVPPLQELPLCRTGNGQLGYFKIHNGTIVIEDPQIDRLLILINQIMLRILFETKDDILCFFDEVIIDQGNYKVDFGPSLREQNRRFGIEIIINLWRGRFPGLQWVLRILG